MENDYTLTVRLKAALHGRLARYAKRIGMSYAGTVRCLLATLEDTEGGMDARDELLALRARLDKRIEEQTP